jgi:hypothetical protein
VQSSEFYFGFQIYEILIFASFSISFLCSVLELIIITGDCNAAMADRTRFIAPRQGTEYLQLMHRQPIGYLYEKYIVGGRIEQILDITGIGKRSIISQMVPSLGPYEE